MTHIASPEDVIPCVDRDGTFSLVLAKDAVGKIALGSFIDGGSIVIDGHDVELYPVKHVMHTPSYMDTGLTEYTLWSKLVNGHKLRIGVVRHKPYSGQCSTIHRLDTVVVNEDDDVIYRDDILDHMCCWVHYNRQ